MAKWADIDIADALELLSPSFPNPEVQPPPVPCALNPVQGPVVKPFELLFSPRFPHRGEPCLGPRNHHRAYE